MTFLHPRYLACVLLVAPLVACGGEITSTPDAGPGPDASVPTDASVPAELRPATGLTATNDIAEHVRVSWASPSTATTGYRLLRDGAEIARLAGSVTSFNDTTATPASLAAPTVKASVGTVRTGIKVTWEPSTAGGTVASYAYSVVALYDGREAPPSESKRGSRPGPVTEYEVTRADGTSFKVGNAVREVEDTKAPLASITLPAATVAVDMPRSVIRLELGALPTVREAATASYRVRALGGATLGAYSAPVEGRRGHGAPNEVDIQWQRSAGAAAAAFADLPGVTGLAWFDSSAPSTEERHFRARSASPWATEAVSTSVPAKNVTWQKFDKNLFAMCGIDGDGRLVCTEVAAGSVFRGPTAERYDRVVLGADTLYHCARRISDHKPACWVGSAAVPSASPDVAVTDVAAGDYYGCGIREADHKIVCWSHYQAGDVPVVESTLGYSSIYGARQNVCGLREADGELDCFGPYLSASFDTLLRPAGAPFRFVALHRIHLGPILDMCALRAPSGLASCSGGYALLDPTVPYQEIVASNFTYLGIRASDGVVVGNLLGPVTRAGTRYHGITGGDGFCALDDRDHVKCVGNGYTNKFAVPEGSYASLAHGRGAMCGIRRSDGRLDCSRYSLIATVPLEVTSTAYRAAVVDQYGAIVAIDATTGALRRFGEAPDGVPAFPALPAGAYKTLTSGCALRQSDGHAVCWAGPTPPTTAFESISGSEGAFCAIRASDKRLECWGATYPGGVPTDPMESVSLGCAVRQSDHKVICWGGDLPPAPGPSLDAPVARVFARATATHCVIHRDDHTVQCFGETPWRSQERFSDWSDEGWSGCGVRENDGKIVCRGGAVPIR